MTITKDKNYWISFAKAAAIRAVKTAAQTAVGMITVGATIGEIEWLYVASVSGASAIVSVLTSIATGLPEVQLPEYTEGE